MIRCLFEVTAKTPNFEGDTGATVRLDARYQHPNPTPEEEQFCKYTPYGHLEARIDNPAALAKLVVGSRFYVDLTEVDAA